MLNIVMQYALLSLGVLPNALIFGGQFITHTVFIHELFAVLLAFVRDNVRRSYR